MIRFVLGTRPESIKIVPVLRALKARGVAFDVVGTGQHADLLSGTGIRLTHNLQIPSTNDPDAYVAIASQAIQRFTADGGLGGRADRANEPGEGCRSQGGASGPSDSRTADTVSASVSRVSGALQSTSACSSDAAPPPSADGSCDTPAWTPRGILDTSGGSGPRGSDDTSSRGVARQQVTAMLGNVQHGNRVQAIVVQGDTASALAGAEAGHALGIPVAHIEAGLRSHDLTDPWPEEGYRLRIDALASYRFCPTGANKQNLVAEGLTGEVTGNTVTDALRLAGARRVEEGRSMVLVTLHRRESFGAPLENVLRGLAAAAQRHPTTPFCWPMHPNPRIHEALGRVSLPPNVLRRGPLNYLDFLTFLCHARAVLTDSGGVVEEACTLGIPTIVARNHTERPEALGVSAKMVGTEYPSSVWDGLDWALETEVEPSAVFGDGHAADRIADHLRTTRGASP